MACLCALNRTGVRAPEAGRRDPLEAGLLEEETRSVQFCEAPGHTMEYVLLGGLLFPLSVH